MIFKKNLDRGNNTDLGFQIAHHILDSNKQNQEFFQPCMRDYFTVLWFKKGQGHYYIDFNKYQYIPNTIVIISKDQIYYFDYPKGSLEFIELSFTEDFISRSSYEIH